MCPRRCRRPGISALAAARRERPRGRAAQERNELAPIHSITSSARPSSGSGTVMPSALAVLRLMISSTLVSCWTSGLGTRKNPAGIDTDLTVQVDDIASVANQPAGRRERAILIDRGYSVAERKCGQLLHLPVEERVGAYDKSAGSHPNQGRKGRIDIPFGAGGQHLDLQPEGTRCCLQVLR